MDNIGKHVAFYIPTVEAHGLTWKSQEQNKECQCKHILTSVVALLFCYGFEGDSQGLRAS